MIHIKSAPNGYRMVTIFAVLAVICSFAFCPPALWAGKIANRKRSSDRRQKVMACLCLNLRMGLLGFSISMKLK